MSKYGSLRGLRSSDTGNTRNPPTNTVMTADEAPHLPRSSKSAGCFNNGGGSGCSTTRGIENSRQQHHESITHGGGQNIAVDIVSSLYINNGLEIKKKGREQQQKAMKEMNRSQSLICGDSRNNKNATAATDATGGGKIQKSSSAGKLRSSSHASGLRRSGGGSIHRRQRLRSSMSARNFGNNLSGSCEISISSGRKNFTWSTSSTTTPGTSRTASLQKESELNNDEKVTLPPSYLACNTKTKTVNTMSSSNGADSAASTATGGPNALGTTNTVGRRIKKFRSWSNLRSTTATVPSKHGSRRNGLPCSLSAMDLGKRNDETNGGVSNKQNSTWSSNPTSTRNNQNKKSNIAPGLRSLPGSNSNINYSSSCNSGLGLLSTGGSDSGSGSHDNSSSDNTSRSYNLSVQQTQEKMVRLERENLALHKCLKKDTASLFIKENAALKEQMRVLERSFLIQLAKTLPRQAKNALNENQSKAITTGTEKDDPEKKLIPPTPVSEEEEKPFSEDERQLQMPATTSASAMSDQSHSDHNSNNSNSSGICTASSSDQRLSQLVLLLEQQVQQQNEQMDVLRHELEMSQEKSSNATSELEREKIRNNVLEKQLGTLREHFEMLQQQQQLSATVTSTSGHTEGSDLKASKQHNDDVDQKQQQNDDTAPSSTTAAASSPHHSSIHFPVVRKFELHLEKEVKCEHAITARE